MLLLHNIDNLDIDFSFFGSVEQLSLHVDIIILAGASSFGRLNENLFYSTEKATESDMLTSISEDSHQDERTECLGTIQAVQDLIMQYEGMNDEDKVSFEIKEEVKEQRKTDTSLSCKLYLVNAVLILILCVCNTTITETATDVSSSSILRRSNLS